MKFNATKNLNPLKNAKSESFLSWFCRDLAKLWQSGCDSLAGNLNTDLNIHILRHNLSPYSWYSAMRLRRTPGVCWQWIMILPCSSAVTVKAVKLWCPYDQPFLCVLASRWLANTCRYVTAILQERLSSANCSLLVDISTVTLGWGTLSLPTPRSDSKSRFQLLQLIELEAERCRLDSLGAFTDEHYCCPAVTQCMNSNDTHSQMWVGSSKACGPIYSNLHRDSNGTNESVVADAHICRGALDR